MILEVIRTLHYDCKDFVCRDENGKEYYVDLYVDGGINYDEWPPVKLIGKKVQCSHLHTYLSIANEVSIYGETK